MSHQQAQLNLLWAQVIVEELRRFGITRFVLSPGSRSTPLAVAIAQADDKLKCSVHYDERGAAFFALGLSRATKQPTALVCTSGTATANYLPAIIEASQDGIPLIVITADRPPELHNVGANQTINQTDIYGSYVRGSVNLPCPDPELPITKLLSTIDGLVNKSICDNPGPVHLNCMFRKPLVPPAGEETIPLDYPTIPETWNSSKAPLKCEPATNIRNYQNEITELKKAIFSAETGIIIAGRMTSQSDQEAVLKLSKILDWPLLADIQSGLRQGNHDRVIHHHSLWLADESQMDNIAVLHFGGRTVSTAWYDYLIKHKPLFHTHIDALPGGIDPGHTMTHRILCSPAEFVAALDLSMLSPNKTGFHSNVKMRDCKVSDLIDHILKEFDQASEIGCARVISSIVPASYCMFVANSMAIRDMNSYAVTDGNDIPVAANRGASGIDGNIATAAGFGLGLNRPLMMLIGDLAFLHDMNSLPLLHELPQPSIVVVANNHGGGIFDLLPVADRTDIMDKYFRVQHELNFEHIAKQFELQYSCVNTNSEFYEIIQSAIKTKKTSLIEVQIDPTQSLKLRQKIICEITNNKNERSA